MCKMHRVIDKPGLETICALVAIESILSVKIIKCRSDTEAGRVIVSKL